MASRAAGRAGRRWPQAVTRSVYAVFGLMVVAAICLWQGLISHDFNIEYVAAYTSRNLPGYFIVSALWAGSEGFAAVLGGGALALLQPGAMAHLGALPRHDAVRRGHHL